jgi:hypothetical protein
MRAAATASPMRGDRTPMRDDRRYTFNVHIYTFSDRRCTFSDRRYTFGDRRCTFNVRIYTFSDRRCTFGDRSSSFDDQMSAHTWRAPHALMDECPCVSCLREKAHKSLGLLPLTVKYKSPDTPRRNRVQFDRHVT